MVVRCIPESITLGCKRGVEMPKVLLAPDIREDTIRMVSDHKVSLYRTTIVSAKEETFDAYVEEHLIELLRCALVSEIASRFGRLTVSLQVHCDAAVFRR